MALTTHEQNRRMDQGDRIVGARRMMRPRLSQEQLADRITAVSGDSMSKSTLQSIEAGNRDAEVGVLRAIAEITGQPLEWLLGESGKSGTNRDMGL